MTPVDPRSLDLSTGDSEAESTNRSDEDRDSLGDTTDAEDRFDGA
jgi:hypothetical protein